MRHARTADLLALASDEAATEETALHASGCAVCGKRLARARTTLVGLKEESAVRRLLSQPAPPARAAFSEQIRASRRGEELAREVLASEQPAEALAALAGDPNLAWALLLTAQRGAMLAVQDPRKALALADAIHDAAAPGSPVPAPEIQAEAALLASHALLNIGRIEEALQRSEGARALFRDAGDDGFGAALCDCASASVHTYAGRYATATRLLRQALRTFAEFGQDQWVGRVECTLGTALAQQGQNRAALPHLDRSLQLLDPVADANSYVAATLNRASTLAFLGRYDEARAGYAQALAGANRHGFQVLAHAVKNGLAELDFLRRDYGRALTAFQRLIGEAESRGLEEQVVVASLYVAECQARLGRGAELQASLTALRKRVQPTPFQVPALEELFACFDRGDLDAGLIEHVRESLTGDVPYRPYRQTA